MTSKEIKRQREKMIAVRRYRFLTKLAEEASRKGLYLYGYKLKADAAELKAAYNL